MRVITGTANILSNRTPVVIDAVFRSFVDYPVLDLGLISIASLGPRASTKVESHVNFTESQKVSQPNLFLQYLTQRS